MPAVTADAAAAPGGAVPLKRGKKKLMIIVGAALALVLAGGGGGVWVLKKRAAQAAAQAASDEEAASSETAVHAEGGKPQVKGMPVYLPLDPFIVNLADKEVDRYAQIGITLELESTVFADQVKAYMPAVRNDVLMLIAHKKAAELQDRAGKLELAREIRRAALKPLEDADDKGGDGDELSVRAVHFSSFIIQ